MNELSVIPDSKELVRQSTDIAGLCREIVVASSLEIEKRKYVRVEGWQAIATAHGCVASARDVRKVEGGMVATGEIRRMQDGQLIATAEGFVGEDEPTWYGGIVSKPEWKNGQRTGRMIEKMMPRRAEYAIRAMAQTRAISRACRGCFAHVVVLMNAGLSTTPAEEVPEGGFQSDFHQEESKPEPTPAPELSDDEKKAKNVDMIRSMILKAFPGDQSTDGEHAFCDKTSALCEDNRKRARLEEFTLDELRLIYPKAKLLLKDLQTNGTAPVAA